MDKYDLAEKYSKTTYLIEATSYETLALWREVSLEYASDAELTERDSLRVSWKDLNCDGYSIGTLDQRPVMLTLCWVLLDDRLVCFWSSPGQVVDYAMIEAHLKEKFPGVSKCDPMNFGHALNHVVGLRYKPPLVLKEHGRVIGREEIEAFRETRVLTTHMITVSCLAVMKGEDGASEIEEAVNGLRELAKDFHERVWLAWLKRDVEALPEVGMSATAAGTSMMVYVLAGRVGVTLRAEGQPENGEYVTLLGYTGEGDNQMHLRGGVGDHFRLAAILSAAIEAGDALRSKLRGDPEVQLAV